MDSRELYPSDEQRRRIMDFIMAAGETLLENGAEVFRVEQTMGDHGPAASICGSSMSTC